MENTIRRISTVSALVVSALLFFVVTSQALAGNKLFVGNLSFDTAAQAFQVEGTLDHGFATAATTAGFDFHVRVDLYDEDGNRIGFVEASTPVADSLVSDRTQSSGSNMFLLKLEREDREGPDFDHFIAWVSVNNTAGKIIKEAGLRSDGELVQ